MRYIVLFCVIYVYSEYFFHVANHEPSIWEGLKHSGAPSAFKLIRMIKFYYCIPSSPSSSSSSSSSIER